MHSHCRSNYNRDPAGIHSLECSLCLPLHKMLADFWSQNPSLPETSHCRSVWLGWRGYCLRSFGSQRQLLIVVLIGVRCWSSHREPMAPWSSSQVQPGLCSVFVNQTALETISHKRKTPDVNPRMFAVSPHGKSN